MELKTYTLLSECLVDMKNRQDQELVQLKDLIHTFESALLSPLKLIFFPSFFLVLLVMLIFLSQKKD